MYTILAAPLQGYTDNVFRLAHSQIIGGVDNYFAPYLRFDNKGQITDKQLRDILPQNNININVTPQVMVNSAQQLITIANLLANMGYKNIDINLGCPYPMVTKHKLGSGLLPFPQVIDAMLSQSIDKINVGISVKMRIGFDAPTQMASVLKVLNNYNVNAITLHPRLATQMYKGTANIDYFKLATQLTVHKLIYNGDINSVNSFNSIAQQLPGTNAFMIGRGIMSNPFLALKIKGGVVNNVNQVFNNFHNCIVNQYSQKLSGQAHLLQKMAPYWQYFSLLFVNSHKVYKGFKKATTFKAYNNHYNSIIQAEQMFID